MRHLNESIRSKKSFIETIPIVFWNLFDPASMSIILDMPSDVITTINRSDNDDYTIQLDRKNLDYIHLLNISDEPDMCSCTSTGCKTLGELKSKFYKEYNKINATIGDIIGWTYRYTLNIGESAIPIGYILSYNIEANPPYNKDIHYIFDAKTAWDKWIRFIWDMPDADSLSGATSYGYALLDLNHRKVIEGPKGTKIDIKIETFAEFGRHNKRYNQI